MNLIEILLPLTDNSGQRFEQKLYVDVRKTLTQRFGGMTAFTRAPAEGTSVAGGETVRDEIVVFEVMTETFDVTWWRNYRHELETAFRQESIVIRVFSVTLV